ncbi:hypothetical protein BGX27_006732 [Mortierella sp. AM989]|nr:hypothetical protein BGX27_006732 [Mortierella sp. AM989]
MSQVQKKRATSSSNMDTDWREELRGLPTEEYIKTCTRIVTIDYANYLEFTMKNDGFTKSQAHSDWKDTIDRLLQCKHQGLLRKGEELQRKWNRNFHKYIDDMHWALQKRKQAAKLQSVTITGLADASVNNAMKQMFQDELGIPAPKATSSLAPLTTSSSSRNTNPVVSSNHTEPSPTTTSIPRIIYEDVNDIEEPDSGHDQDRDESDDENNPDNDDDKDNDNDTKELQLLSAVSPFDDLVAVLFRKYNHRVPAVATISPPLSGTMKELHTYASLNLSQWGRIPDTKRKSTMLALSGILNTMDNEMQFFNDFAATKAACFDEHFTLPTIEMKAIIDELLEAMGSEKSLQRLKMFCRENQLEATKTSLEGSNRARVINAVEYLCTLIEQEKWTESLSETEFVAIWEHVFSHLLLTTIATRIGELGLVESKSDRQKTEWLFALNNHNVKSRKVDLLFQSKIKNFSGKECRHNIAVFEAKSADSNEKTLWIQIRKALRLNKSILSSLRLLGTEISPILLDLQGQRGYVYTIRKFDGYYGAGKVTEQCIRLPTTAHEMCRFIKDGGLSALFKIKERLLQVDGAVRDAIWNYEEQEHQHKMSTTTQLKRVVDDIPTIWTPTKKRKDNTNKRLTTLQLPFNKSPHLTFL